jgi:RNA polymerase sigma-70 factor (ECF subfamily)
MAAGYACNTRGARDTDRVMERSEQIYAEHVDAVRAYVRRRAPESLVEDVVADVFVVALRRIDEVPRNALPWLYGVARKTLANERRRQSRVAPVAPEVSYEPEPVGDSQLAAAFAALSDADREILRLVAWEGLALRRAARVLECSPVAARVRYHRAKARLRARLDAASSFRPEPRGATR